ncbi:MAG TPA: hypothetical protein VNL13_08755 [Sulfolobales archaeon]|nr:hypothetical protein [Sulfolobales archaeon]
MSAVQEQVTLGVGNASSDQGNKDQQGVVSSNNSSLIVDGSVGVVDIVGVIDKINTDLRSISNRVDGIDNSLKSLKNSVDVITDIRRDIESLGSAIQSMKEYVESVKKDASISRLIGVVGVWKLALCLNNRSGVCYAWRLGENLHEITAIYGDQVVVEVDGVKRVRVSIAYHLCGICPLFRPRAP